MLRKVAGFGFSALGVVATSLPLQAYAQGLQVAENDEIIITLDDRRPSAIDLYPGNIKLINEDALATINADHISEALARAPGVLIHRGSGQEHLTAIRSPVLTGGAGAGSFLFLENGVPLRSAGFANVNGLFEAQSALAERIEVVRGPSGAFYGTNAIHGVINVITPSALENFNSAGISLSEFHKKGDLAIARSNRGKGYYAGLSLQEDTGFRADSGFDKQQATLRVADKTGTWNTDTILTLTNLNQETAGFIQGPDAFEDRQLSRTNPNPNAYRDSRAIRLQHTLSREFGEGELRLTPFARYTELEFRQHFLPSQAIEENSHASLGIQSAYYTSTSWGGWTVGLDAEYTEGELTEEQFIPTIFSFTQGLHYDFEVDATSVSPFTQVDWALSDTLTLTAAARIDYTNYDYNNRTDANRVGRFTRPADRSDDFLTVSPKVSLLKIADNGSYFLNYAEGARPPQVTDLYRLQLNQTADGIDPERIRSVEAGWRGAINDAVDMEIAAYFAEKENFLFRDADGFNVTDGRTRHTGIEIDLSAQLSETLFLSANGTYAEHTYRFDRPVNSTVNATEAISKGNEVDTAPNTLGGARLTWLPQPDLSLEAEWVHVGEYFTDASNSNDYPGHDIFHLRAEKQAGFFTAFAAIRNIFDERYAERADFAFGNERFFPDEGRTLTIGLRFKN